MQTRKGQEIEDESMQIIENEMKINFYFTKMQYQVQLMH